MRGPGPTRRRRRSSAGITTRPAEELYDLRADPHEQHNLAADPAHADRLAELRRELDAWMAAQGDEGLATEEAHRPGPAAP